MSPLAPKGDQVDSADDDTVERAAARLSALRDRSHWSV
jgi:hypothetical protein